MINNFEFVPWSGRRYKINISGELYDHLGNKIETFLKDNHVYVNIEWVLGKRDYILATIVLFSFKLISIPEHFIDEVIPLYKDLSITNLSPINLLYKFKNGKIEVDYLPGFYYIPFYTEYAININGDLINIETKKLKKWSITKPNEFKNSIGGYLYSRVINTRGFSNTLFQHRALCYVFKDYGSNVLVLHVNHKDGRPNNNFLDNMEWVTPKENNIHAVENGLRGDNKPVLCKDLNTGKVIRFNSINQAGKYFNTPRAGFIHHRLHKSPTKVFSDMLVFKFDDGLPWPKFDMDKIYRYGSNEDYIARNVFTGEKVIFSSVNGSGMDEFGVKPATILSHIKNRLNIPVNGWNFRYLSENKDWPNHTEKHLKIYSKFPIYPPDGVVVKNIKTNEEMFFESVSICCNKFGFSKHVLYNLIKTKNLYKDQIFELFDIRKNLGLPIQ